MCERPKETKYQGVEKSLTFAVRVDLDPFACPGVEPHFRLSESVRPGDSLVETARFSFLPL